MPIHDYNGLNEWSAVSIQARYREYARKLGVEAQTKLLPRTHSVGDRHWVYPVMETVIMGIELGDPACIELGIDFISTDQSFPSGRILKSYTARALRRSELSTAQCMRIRARVSEMLRRGYVPQEYKEYAKLVRKIGLGDEFTGLDDLPIDRPGVQKYVSYFKSIQGE